MQKLGVARLPMIGLYGIFWPFIFVASLNADARLDSMTAARVLAREASSRILSMVGGDGSGVISVADWGAGEASWQGARRVTMMAETKLWDEENVCDPRAVKSSAPLTVLFGISKFWNVLRRQRHERRRSGPLEIHVIGASYPFEGRSDWSLLASRRPPDVPGVRVILILGTPWQDDNLPELKHASTPPDIELVDLNANIKKHHPVGGRWKDGKVRCASDEALKQYDAGFARSDLCRDHGNGLEVVCLEKFYQDVNLPIPDLAVMFSPGFPQLARRSWDRVLQDLLDRDVMMLVSDEVSGNSLGSMFTDDGAKEIELGGDLAPSLQYHGENTDTLIAMQAYNAQRLGSQRNPFPLLVAERDEVIAKNAVVQVFQGRTAGAERESLPLASVLNSDIAAVKGFDWGSLHDKDYARQVESSLLIPVSPAYERACRTVHEKDVFHSFERKGLQPFNSEERVYLQELGLVSGTGKQVQPGRWGPKAWLFFLKKLNAVSFA